MVSESKQTTTLSLSIAALGVVYGDIGTSPLYAMRESLQGLPINTTTVFGILSLIFWTLTAIISVKYLFFLLKADNEGEGGILALLALVKRTNNKHSSLLFLIAIFGAGLILGDGMLTPAISVLSAVEGIHIMLPEFSTWVLPLTCIILLTLFAAQYRGTAAIGFIFGPIILIWFIILALIGIPHILAYPSVLKAINPVYAYHFFHELGWKGYALLGGVFLVTTGAEALYADLGHFGKKPIRLTWFLVVFPALFINYFGQGAYLLQHPSAIKNPFYLSMPSLFLFPLLIIATLATVIASQAIISATFSIARQAILLGLYPRLPIVQTSTAIHGQIYVPQMNLIIGVGSLLLVLAFKSSDSLAHAYGIAVNLHMFLTTALGLYIAVKQWHWLWAIIPLSCLAIIDMVFLGANIQKLETGGWVPIIFAAICAFIMYTWQAGRRYLVENYYMKKREITKILRQFDYKSMFHLPETTAVFITDIYDKSGGTFLHFLKLNRTLPEKMILLDYNTENIPYIPMDQRLKVNLLKSNICEVTLCYGFMDDVSIPRDLKYANEHHLLPFNIHPERLVYFIEIPNVVASREKKTLWFHWQEQLFAFLVRNYSANMDIEFYKLPFNHTIAMGTYYVV